MKTTYFILSMILIFVWSSCGQKTIRYQFTEKKSPFDTVIIVPNIRQYRFVESSVLWEFNDTVMLGHIKRPPQRLEGSREMLNSYVSDTIRVHFDKYKATKVRVYQKIKFYKHNYSLSPIID